MAARGGGGENGFGSATEVNAETGRVPRLQDQREVERSDDDEYDSERPAWPGQRMMRRLRRHEGCLSMRAKCAVRRRSHVSRRKCAHGHEQERSKTRYPRGGARDRVPAAARPVRRPVTDRVGVPPARRCAGAAPVVPSAAPRWGPAPPARRARTLAPPLDVAPQAAPAARSNAAVSQAAASPAL